jgi:hypothetical protein
MDGQEVSRGDQMKTSIATVSISGYLREKRAAIAAAAFDGVEVFENDLLALDGSPADPGSDHESVVASLRRIMMEANMRLSPTACLAFALWRGTCNFCPPVWRDPAPAPRQCRRSVPFHPFLVELAARIAAKGGFSCFAR